MGRKSASSFRQDFKSSLTSSRPGVLELGSFLRYVLIFALEQFFRGVSPCPEVVLVKDTRSQFTWCSHSFFALIKPDCGPEGPGTTRSRRRAFAVFLGRIAAGVRLRQVLPAVEIGLWFSRSVCQASSTAGLKVTTRIRLAPSFFASW
jgi:hypothetical protein